jgi:hypothetical protein
MTPTAIALCTAALASVLAALGCGSSGKDTTKPPIPGHAASMAQPASVALLAVEQRSIFQILPGNANTVLGMNVLQMRSSPLFVELLPWIEEKYSDSVRRLQSECGIDPAAVVHAVTVAGQFGSSRDMIMMARGLERPALIRCLSRPERRGKAAEIIEDGALTHVRQRGKSTWIGWLDDATLILGPELGRAQIEERLRDIEGLTANAAMMELIDKVATESGLWLVMLQSPDGGLPAPIRALYATLNVTGGLELDGGVRVTDAQQARSLAELTRAQLQSVSGSSLGTYLARIEIATSDSDILFRLVLDDSEVADLLQHIAADPLFKTIFRP